MGSQQSKVVAFILLCFRVGSIRAFGPSHVLPGRLLKRQSVEAKFACQNRRQTSRCLFLAKNNDSSGQEEALLAGIATCTILLAAITVWSNLSSDPAAQFELDFYTALDRMLDTASSVGGVVAQGDNIVELPPLSPAEQLVGAVFGPPH